MASALASLLSRLSAAPLAGRRPVFLVGGVVRDLLLGREPRDVDILMEAGPRERGGLLHALREALGTEPVVFDRRPPVTYRFVSEGAAIDASFCEAGGLTEELERRDFTINAMAVPLGAASRAVEDAGGTARARQGLAQQVIDPLGGLPDLAAGRIAPSTARSIRDDPLRMLRAVRLEATLPRFEITPALAAEIAAGAARLRETAVERISAEMTLILGSRRAGPALRRMDALGLLATVLPELEPLRGLRQPPRHHDHDALSHTLLAVQEADGLSEGCEALRTAPLCADATLVLKWAALLHDAGKAATARVGPDGVPRFHGHESVSSALAEETLRRLRVPTRIAEPAKTLVSMHLRLGALASAGAGDRPLMRLVRAAGDLLPLLALLALADRHASGGEGAAQGEAALVEVACRALRLREEFEASGGERPLLDGDEVMSILGIPPGPRIGSILRWLGRLRAEGRLAKKEEAVALLKGLPPPRFR